MVACEYLSDKGVVDQVIQRLRPSVPSAVLRTRLYYGVCVLFRLALFNLVFIFRNEWWVPPVVGVAALVSVVRLAPSVADPGRQWWSKRFQLVVAVLVVVACVVVWWKKRFQVVVPALLYVSLLGGLAWRQVCCCG